MNPYFILQISVNFIIFQPVDEKTKTRKGKMFIVDDIVAKMTIINGKQLLMLVVLKRIKTIAGKNERGKKT